MRFLIGLMLYVLLAITPAVLLDSMVMPQIESLQQSYERADETANHIVQVSGSSLPKR
jgi:hypothetical protein